MYDGLWRAFKLHGALRNWWRARNGLVQGDAISMIALNSVVTSIVEVTKSLNKPNIHPKTYADDISAVVTGTSIEQVQGDLRVFHNIVRAYTLAGGGELNTKKCFTFGHDPSQNLLNTDFEHLKELRIVGGSFVMCEDTSVLRISTWKNSIQRIKCIPRSWIVRARMMLATQSQATFGQGTHSMFTDVSILRTVRSDIMRSLWHMDFYSHSPLITMSRLCPVQLDPEFGVRYEGLRAVTRVRRLPHVASERRRRF